MIIVELDAALCLAADMRAKAAVKLEERQAQLALATALANRGLYEALDSSQLAAATWRDAIATLTKSTTTFSNVPDLVEQERVELLEKLHGYLSKNL